MNEDRKLIFVGDSDRVKSYSWDVEFGRYRTSLPGVHTLNTREAPGPLEILPNGRAVRAGEGKAFVWTIDDLPQHGPRGRRIGRGSYSTAESMREDDIGDAIEMSAGTGPSNTVAFADKKCSPSVWKLHAPTATLITGTDGRRCGVYECTAIDLEHGGKYAQRYLGHGGDIEDISMSEGDVNTFVTAANDGLARLYDVRQPLPVLSFENGTHTERCPAAVFLHPDGVPSMCCSLWHRPAADGST